jgi:hypothetical protein
MYALTNWLGVWINVHIKEFWINLGKEFLITMIKFLQRLGKVNFNYNSKIFICIFASQHSEIDNAKYIELMEIGG